LIIETRNFWYLAQLHKHGEREKKNPRLES